jgi:predicted ATPase
MRSTIDWSYQLMRDVERFWFRRLGVFVGGCAPEQLARLEPRVSVEAVTEVVLDLADRGLVQIEEADDGLRCDMLFLIREFALEKLVDCVELVQVRRAHAEAYLELAQQAWPDSSGSQMRMWLRRFRRERGNLDAALAWCESESGDARLGLELVGLLLYYWLACEPLAGLAHLDRLLLRAPLDVPPIVRARASLLDGVLKSNADQVDRGRVPCQRMHRVAPTRRHVANVANVA